MIKEDVEKTHQAESSTDIKTVINLLNKKYVIMRDAKIAYNFKGKDE